jgi:hypothetical protein
LKGEVPRAAVVDTNLVVGGLLPQTPSSPLVIIVDGMFAGRFPFVLSPTRFSALNVAMCGFFIKPLRVPSRTALQVGIHSDMSG